ncbi:histidinol dehydrogenase [Psychromicrobium xiongbiense]|uniref:histidinol dehydrogenase n=1 Tax=Psychromicrobium xiongbiense TaxID=3051184 RepID=UPI003B22274A
MPSVEAAPEDAGETELTETGLIRQIDLRGRELSTAQLRAVVPRAEPGAAADAEDTVRRVLSRVEQEGWPAVLELTAAFDRIKLENPRVPAAALQEALRTLDPTVRRALETSIERAQKVARAQRPDTVSVEVAPGATVTLRWEPLLRVGLYVPGGLAVYPSSVIMNVVPALAAGVGSMVLVSPPQKEWGGLPHPTILAAAALLGVEEVYSLGGAQAIAALAYGLEAEGECQALEPVDLITGPGNRFVATAKRLLRGRVGIDAEAGPTEIAILADDQAPAAYVAADLLSQAEHDPLAGSVLVTSSPELAAGVRQALEGQLAATKNAERARQALAGQQSAIVLVDDLEQGLAVVNAYAAEHLEVMTDDAAILAGRVTSAGAIFIGPSSPVSLGDYCAGSNHVLPTGGTAAFASGLGVHTFLKAIQEIQYDEAALAEVAGSIIALADAEGLPAHGEAVAVRLQ